MIGIIIYMITIMGVDLQWWGPPCVKVLLGLPKGRARLRIVLTLPSIYVARDRLGLAKALKWLTLPRLLPYA